MIELIKRVVPLIAVLLPALALAKPWNGITPGETPKAEVVKRFGEPSKKLAQGDKEVMAYIGDQAIKGTPQAQFVIKEGKVEQMVVFPATTLELPEIEDTYGKACAVVEKNGKAAHCYHKQLTDEFRTYLWYKRLGLVVFLNEDKKTVHSIIFNSPVAANATP